MRVGWFSSVHPSFGDVRLSRRSVAGNFPGPQDPLRPKPGTGTHNGRFGGEKAGGCGGCRQSGGDRWEASVRDRH